MTLGISQQESGAATLDAQATAHAGVREAGSATFTFWKGRVGLYAILKAGGIGPGNSVLVPGYTCAMVPATVVHAGAAPVYADIDPATYNCSLNTIQQAWDRHPDQPLKAIVLQHTFGIAADVTRIVSWAKRVGIMVIEDCAHALATRYCDGQGRWHRVGEGGDAAIFSSQWSKPVSTGLGGWVRLNDQRLKERVSRFHANECVSPSPFESGLLAAQVAIKDLLFRPSFYWTMAGAYRWVTRRGLVDGSVSNRELAGEMRRDFAKRMSGFQRWLLNRRLADQRREGRSRRLRELYDEELRRAGIPNFRDPAYSDSVLLRYPLRVKNKEEVLVQARRHHVEIGEWFNHPIHPKESNSVAFGYRPGDCPEGELAGKEVINLPMHQRIDENQARRAVRFVLQMAKR